MPKVMRLLGLVVPVILALASCGSPQSSNSESRSEHPITPSVSLLWQTTFFDDSTQPAVSGGRIYLTRNDLIRPYLYALDELTGKRIWEFSPPMAGLRGVTSPVVAGDLVIFCAKEWLEAGHPSNDIGTYDSTRDKFAGHVYAVEAESGIERWSYSVGSEITELIISDDTLYFGMWDQHVKGDPASGLFSGIYALGVGDGNLKWEMRFEGVPINSPVALSDTTLYFTTSITKSEAARLYAVDIETHQEKWRFQVDEDRWNWQRPLIAEGLVIIRASGDPLHWIGNKENVEYKSDGDILYSLEASTGRLIWSHSVGPTLESSPVYDSLYDVKPGIVAGPVLYGNLIILGEQLDVGGDTYGLGPDIELYLVARDIATGDEKWRYKVEHEAYVGTNKLSQVGNYILLGNFSNDALRAFDPNSGAPLWEYKTLESPIGLPIWANGNIYIVDYEGTLYALKPSP